MSLHFCDDLPTMPARRLLLVLDERSQVGLGDHVASADERTDEVTFCNRLVDWARSNAEVLSDFGDGIEALDGWLHWCGIEGGEGILALPGEQWQRREFGV